MNRRLHNPDYLLMIVTFALVAIGIFLVFDSSYARAGMAERLGKDSFFYWKRQMVAGVIGLLAMQVAAMIPYAKWRKVAVISLPISVILLLLVWVPGISVVFADAHRWIRIPVFGTLQSSEIAKLSLILYLARAGSIERHRVRRWGSILPRLLVIGLFAGLVVIEPDMGSAIILMMIGLSMLLASGMRLSHFAAIVTVVLVLGVLAILDEPYRVGRVLAFLEPWKHYLGSGYQICHSLVALGSGGTLGLGLAQGIQKFFYLPAGHTDFIFATVGEEMGLFGTLSLLSLFFVLFYRGMAIAHRTRDTFGMLLAVGVSTMIASQALLNIAVVTSSVPATGVPLPFISYGGSSLIITLFSVGILVSISRYPDPAIAEEGGKGRDEDRPVGRGDGRPHLSGTQHGRSAGNPRRRHAVSG